MAKKWPIIQGTLEVEARDGAAESSQSADMWAKPRDKSRHQLCSFAPIFTVTHLIFFVEHAYGCLLLNR